MKRGIETTVVEALPRILNIVDEDMSDLAHKELEAHNVAIKTGTKVVSIAGSERVDGVELDSGEKLPADLVLMSVGVRPNTEFAESAGQLGEKMAVMVDAT